MATLHLEGLVKRYGQISALNGVDLEVGDGEFFALLGPSAAGKTTTLRAIAGLEKLDAGRIYLDGEDITEVPVRRRNMAMVFQSFALYPHLSTYNNLAYPLREAGLSRREIAKRVQEAAELLRIKHTLKRKPASLSGGEQQRLAIGRAIIRQPRLFLLDEPLTNLDAKLRHAMRAEFKRLHRELGATMIFATPDQLEALSMGQRIAILRDGQIVQTGTADELYLGPCDEFVAQLVGDPPMNLVAGTLRRDARGARLELPFAAIDTAALHNRLESFQPGTEFLLGIRPHDLRLAGDDRRGLMFNAKIRLAEPQGDITILDLEANGAALRLVVAEIEGAKRNPGETIGLAFEPARTRLFMKESGLALG
ncbi:MAG: ABC transporter ATP-binding protein [Alphaproteobacteria bacterium]|nr:ABC transporter ATP-binding protein [Alphaproteobacteria bacterium]